MTDLNSDIEYADMNDGSWAIIVQSPENDFVVQREFNLTAGGSANLVIITASLCNPCCSAVSNIL